MTANSLASKKITSTAIHFFADWLAIMAGYFAGAVIRFETWVPDKVAWYLPALLAAALAAPVLFYIGGQYSRPGLPPDKWSRLRWFLVAMGISLLMALGVGSLEFNSRVGRGVLLYGFPIGVLLCGIHHAILHRRQERRKVEAVCIVSSEADEKIVQVLSRHSHRIRIVGAIHAGDHAATGALPLLGHAEKIAASSLAKEIGLVMVRDHHLFLPGVSPLLRNCRYAGRDVISLADACEEVFQAVPLQLVTEPWLFRACGQSGLLYIKKLKRLFDVLAALAFLVLLSPLLLISMAIVRFGSKGPVFFHQTRLGRDGRPFEVIKLRTMKPDAEADGPRWAAAKMDKRCIPFGALLRKFRLDEIPQMINVLRGDMSFVGPRPERPEFYADLERAIPFYRERLLVQPGITGWAQVRYPYGASLDDAWRKHELDLYYMKHMSLVLDFFILLETVRTVIAGGARDAGAVVRGMQEIKKAAAPEPARAPANIQEGVTGLA